MFLDQDQLKRLTGRSRPAEQMEYLRRNGIPFKPDADGKPVVLVAAVNAALGGTAANESGPRLRFG